MPTPIELKPMGKSAPRSAPPVPPRHPATSGTTHSSIGDALPGSLGKAYRTAEEKAKAVVHLQEGGMDAIGVWGLGLASWFSILAIPLLLFPRILLFFSQTPPPSSSSFSTAGAGREEHYDLLTPLESTLCLSISLGLFAISLISLFTLVPTYEPPTINPSRKPLLGILVGLTTISGIVMWNVKSIGGLGTVIGGGNSVVAIWGWWVVVFGEGSKLTKKDGKGGKTPERFKRL